MATHYTCDRCGVAIEKQAGLLRYGPELDPTEGVDLCPGCLVDFVNWVQAGVERTG